MYKYFSIGILTIIFTWLFAGIYYSAPFHEWTFFVKHQPSTKFIYYSPISESDRSAGDLTAAERYEELAYDNLILQMNSHSVYDRLSFLPYLAVPLIITFFVVGIIAIRLRIHIPSKAFFATYGLTILLFTFSGFLSFVLSLLITPILATAVVYSYYKTAISKLAG